MVVSGGADVFPSGREKEVVKCARPAFKKTVRAFSLCLPTLHLSAVLTLLVVCVGRRTLLPVRPAYSILPLFCAHVPL